METKFIGIMALKEQHAAQVETFARWAQAADWQAFHDNHYDWWAFPVNRKSSYGDAYKLTPEALLELRADPDFLARWREGVRLVCLSWGWELSEARYLQNPTSDQHWAHWPVRLYKMAHSAWLLGQRDVYASLRKLALDLQAGGEAFIYGDHDLFWVFQHPESNG